MSGHVRRGIEAIALAGLTLGIACGTDAVGVDGCRQIEGARCRRAPACSISLQPPYRTSGTDVQACIRFYDIACLHGLGVADPGSSAVGACVAAINTGVGCGVVSAPETDPACSWLAPTTATTDSTDAAVE